MNTTNSKFSQYALACIMLGTTQFYACSSSSSSSAPQASAPKSITKGVITEIEEVEENKFLISKETYIDNPENSQIITKYLNGTSDTLSLEQARVIANDSTSTNNRRSGMSSALRYGMMGYFFSQNFGGPRAGAYQNSGVYSQAQAAQNNFRTPVKTRVATKPTNSTTGFGKPSSSSSSSSSSRRYSGGGRRSFGG